MLPRIKKELETGATGIFLLRSIKKHGAKPAIVVYVLEHGRHYFAEIERHGLEGVMAKRLDSAYSPGRRLPDWLKIKVATYLRGTTESGISAPRRRQAGEAGMGFTKSGRRDSFGPDPAAGRPLCTCRVRVSS